MAIAIKIINDQLIEKVPTMTTHGGLHFTHYLNKENAICSLCKNLIMDEDVEMYSASLGLDANYHSPVIPKICVACSIKHGQEGGALSKSPPSILTTIYWQFQPPTVTHNHDLYSAFPFNGKTYNDSLEKSLKGLCNSLVSISCEKIKYPNVRRLCFIFNSSTPAEVEQDFKKIKEYFICYFPKAQWGHEYETLQSINL